MKIDREKLYELYMREVDQISEEYDWVSVFGPKEIVGMIASILEENPSIISEIIK